MVTTRQLYTLLKMSCLTKHIEVNCHIIRKGLEEKIVMTKHVSSGHKLANVLTKPLGRIHVDFICDKLSMYDIYAPA